MRASITRIPNLSSDGLISTSGTSGILYTETLNNIVSGSGGISTSYTGGVLTVYTSGSGNFEYLEVSGALKTPLNTESDGATITFDMDVSNTHTVTLGGDRILAVSNVDVGQRFIIRLTQDGTGTRTVTWFNTIKWPGAIVPTLTTNGGKTDVFGFLCTSGNNYDGYVIGYNL